MKISYIKGNATKPVGEGKKLILHIVNSEGGWGSGFVVGLNKEFGTQLYSPREEYLSWYNANRKNSRSSVTGRFMIGQVQFCPQPNDIVVVNMVGQAGPGGYLGFPPIRYQALEECLMRVREAINKADKPVSLHAPRFGSGLAGGKWEIIEEIILRVFKDVDIEMTIYDWDGK